MIFNLYRKRIIRQPTHKIVVSLILLLGIRVVSDKVAVIIAVYGFLGNRHFEYG